MKNIKLNDGTKIPQIGFGTWQLKSEDVDKSLEAAIKNNYKHIDTAQIYNNEYEIGDFLINNELDPQSIYLTTKIWISNFTSKEVFMKSVNQSLKRLGVKKVNLILLHWAVGEKITNQAYKWLEEVKDQNLTDSIGVSNFNINRLKSILKICKYKPVINQVQYDIITQQKAIIDFCKENDIAVEGYSLLKPYLGTSSRELMTDEEKKVINRIAEIHKKTAPQIILKYALQSDVIIFPKSRNPERIKSNIDLFDFELSNNELSQIKKLDRTPEVQRMDAMANGQKDDLLETTLLFERNFKVDENGKYINDENSKMER